MSAETAKTGDLPLPRWLTRAEKADFRRIERIRDAAGKPVSEAEVDAVCDYVSARWRLSDLRRIYRRAAAELRADPSFTSAQREVLAIARQLDAASAHARRLGKAIGLGPAHG